MAIESQGPLVSLLQCWLYKRVLRVWVFCTGSDSFPHACKASTLSVSILPVTFTLTVHNFLGFVFHFMGEVLRLLFQQRKRGFFCDLFLSGRKVVGA